MKKLQAWRCRKGHVLGMIRLNGRRRSMLELYRHAVDPGAEVPVEVEVMGLLVGGMRDIRCDVCGDVAAWHSSRARVNKKRGKREKMIIGHEEAKRLINR